MRLTTRQKILARDDRTVFLLFGHDASDREVYSLLSVAIDRLEGCLAAMDRDGFEPGQWGEILFHGVGQPTAYQLKALRQQFDLVAN
ncbi:MAG: hypothetical protein AAF213_12415 [Pseudomonadota bacterium]